MPRFARAAAIGLCGVVLASLMACRSEDTPSFKGTDISGTHLGRELAMSEPSGQPVTLASYAGKVSVYFFGFTQCPDVCPTAMAQLAEVMQRLGKDADQVQVVMISVDPARDTPQVLDAYVRAFDPRFVALRGTPEQTQAAASTFKAYFARSPLKDGGYSMDHTAAFYILDRQGEARVLASGTVGTDALVHDIRALL